MHTFNSTCRLWHALYILSKPQNYFLSVSKHIFNFTCLPQQALNKYCPNLKSIFSMFLSTCLFPRAFHGMLSGSKQSLGRTSFPLFEAPRYSTFSSQVSACSTSPSFYQHSCKTSDDQFLIGRVCPKYEDEMME